MWMRNFLPENTQEEREGKKEAKIWDDGEEKSDAGGCVILL